MKQIRMTKYNIKRIIPFSIAILFVIVFCNSCNNITKDKNIMILVKKKMINPETNKAIFDYYVNYNDTTELEGVAKFYDQSGNLKTQAVFENGKMVGASVVFNEKGNIVGISRFKDGEVVETTSFYENGLLKFKKTYKNKCLYNFLIYKDTLGKDIDFGDFKNGTGNLYDFDSLNVKTKVTYLKDGKALYEITGKDTFKFEIPKRMQ